MLTGVVIVLVLLLAPYVRPWAVQRAQIVEGQEQVAELQREVQALTEERRRWDDDAYVRAQARERLHFVMPGETGYVVLDDTPDTQPDRGSTVALPGKRQKPGSGPWYARVWSSVQIAGDPTTEQARSAPPAATR